MKSDKSNSEINQEFLENEKWQLVKDYPLFQEYKRNDICLTIGAYGEFSITEYHWCNKNEIQQCMVLNNLTKIKEYYLVLKLLKYKK